MPTNIVVFINNNKFYHDFQQQKPKIIRNNTISAIKIALFGCKTNLKGVLFVHN
jgi:ribosomal protein L16 Arg81 hydroxylase